MLDGTRLMEGVKRTAQRSDEVRLRHIVYLMQTPLNPRDIERFGMATMAADGVSVTVVDAKGLINPFLAEMSAAQPIPGITQYVVRSAKDLGGVRALLRAADFAICLVAFDGNPAVLKVYRTLAQAGTPYLVISANAFPGFARYRGERRHWFQRGRDAFKRLVEGQVDPIKSILFRLPPRGLGLRGPALIIHGGRSSRAGARMFPVMDGTRAINAHAMDYDLYLQISTAPPVQTQTAIFIDEHIGFQRDMIAMGARPTATPVDFYPKLRRFFDRLEDTLGLEVIIAANPRADYRDKPGLFGDRRIEYQATANLIAASQLVIGHRSTALGFAVMFGRPVMLVATEEMYAHWVQRPAMDAFSEALGTPVHLIDDNAALNLAGALTFDGARYDRYMEDYVKTSGSADRPFWSIAGDEIRRYLAEENHAAA